jgi:hypothetical protein
MKILDGEMKERRFAWPEGHEPTTAEAKHKPQKEDEMTLTGETGLKVNDVAYMHGNLPSDPKLRDKS